MLTGIIGTGASRWLPMISIMLRTMRSAPPPSPAMMTNSIGRVGCHCAAAGVRPVRNAQRVATMARPATRRQNGRILEITLLSGLIGVKPRTPPHLIVAGAGGRFERAQPSLPRSVPNPHFDPPVQIAAFIGIVAGDRGQLAIPSAGDQRRVHGVSGCLQKSIVH